jgi:transcriptional regulator with XRE-family HTH domain
MADYRAERSIGSRIAAARRARGFRTTKEFAAAMAGTGVTAAVLENIESGRKANLDISQVLNIAHALGVPVINLLAPMARPNAPIDLPNLSGTLADMTASEFDAWMSTVPNAGYTAVSAAERNERGELQALRELQVAQRELHRLEAADRLEGPERPAPLRDAATAHIEAMKDRISELRNYLSSAGWEL